MNAQSLYRELKTLQIPVAYGTFQTDVTPPFIVYLGDGQEHFPADNTYYYKQDSYRLHYCFDVKDETIENSIETLLLNMGLPYYKSEDVYIENEKMWQITYEI